MYDIRYLSGPLHNLLVRLLGKFPSDGSVTTSPHLEESLAEHRQVNRQLGIVLARMGIRLPDNRETVTSAQSPATTLVGAIRAAADTRLRLGNLLIANGRITPEELDQALREQKRTGELLGDVLIRIGIIVEKERDVVLATQLELKTAPPPSPFKLGDILIASGQITREQLNDTLEQQKHTPGKLGELLVGRGFIRQSQVEQGIRLQQILVSLTLGTCLALCAPVTASAGGSSAGICATASVKKIARMTILNQQPQMVITADNIARGYLELPAASRLQVRNSSRSGYMITFEVQGGPFRNVLINGLGSELQISFGSGWVLMPFSRTAETIELTYRFILAADAVPGTYPWPVRINATSI